MIIIRDPHCRTLFHVPPCLSVSLRVSLCLSRSSYVSPCLFMYLPVSVCLSPSFNVSPFLRVSLSHFLAACLAGCQLLIYKSNILATMASYGLCQIEYNKQEIRFQRGCGELEPPAVKDKPYFNREQVFCQGGSFFQLRFQQLWKMHRCRSASLRLLNCTCTETD